MTKSAIFALAFSFAGVASASNILIGDFTGSGATFAERPVRTLSGGVLSTTLSGTTIVGAQIRLGYFSGFDGTNDPALSNALASTDPATFATAMARFIPFGEGYGGDADLGVLTAGTTSQPRVTPRTVNLITNVPGRLAGSVTAVNAVGGTANSINANGAPFGTRIFMLVYNAPVASATELGIFSATSWTMPTDNLINPTFNTVDVDATAEIFRGSASGSELRLALIVPEPSAAMLGLAGLGLLVRRRR